MGGGPFSRAFRGPGRRLTVRVAARCSEDCARPFEEPLPLPLSLPDRRESDSFLRGIGALLALVKSETTEVSLFYFHRVTRKCSCYGIQTRPITVQQQDKQMVLTMHYLTTFSGGTCSFQWLTAHGNGNHG